MLCRNAPLPPGRVEWTKGATRRSRSRRRSRREGRERSRSRRSRKRPMQAEPKEHKPQKQPRQVKASEAGLYDLVLQVIERWGIACDDEVGDERFKSAINLVLSARVFGPREVERINSQLNRQLKRPKVRPRGPGSTSNLRVPTALAELEKRNVDMVRNLNMQEGILAGEAQAQAAASLPGRSRAVPVAEPAAEPEPGLGPDKEPEEREELEEEEPEAPQEARMVEDEADAGEAEVEEVEEGEVVDEESPASPAEVPGLAPFTPSPNGDGKGAFSDASMAQVSPADLKSLPNLPGYTFPEYKDNYARPNSLNVVNGVRIEQKEGFSHDKPKFVKVAKVQDVWRSGSLPDSQTRAVFKNAGKDIQFQELPAWDAFDRHVLRFTGYFKESVVETNLENYRVRKVTIYYYLEDDTCQIQEPKMDNSGMPQGALWV
eukprot:symbB.v1.2.027577.t1/scaffold2840.1/size69153/2